MSKKIKVLHILWSGRSGGMERFVRDITIYSNRKEFEHIVCFLSCGGWLADQITKNGTEVYYLEMKSGFSIVKSMRLFKVINRIKPHIIHNHIRNYLANILILCFLKIPKVYFEHGGDLVGNNPKRKILFYKLFGRLYSLILANSNYVRNKIIQLSKIDPDKVKTFYIGIDVERYNKNTEKKDLKENLGIPVENKVIGIVGRLTEQKGIDDFIKVCEEINKINTIFRLSYLVVGEGALRPALENMASEYKTDIIFLGDRKDVPQILYIFDVFLFTSKWEPFGIVLLEALASKIPIVGFSVPGANEIIERGGGILIKERNHRKLAEAVVDLLKDKERFKELIEKGYQNVMRNFNVIESIKKLEKEYSLIINGYENPPRQ